MNFDIIKHHIGKSEINSISARELHKQLQVKSRFNDWIQNRIKKYGFIENEDFIAITKSLVTAQGNSSKFLDYIVTIDMAKELAMIENNKIGRDVRRHFIKIEKEFYDKLDSKTVETETDRNLKGLNFVFQNLKVNEASKILMTETLYKKIGLETSYLPKYSDENHTSSLSVLLKKYEIGISATKLNKNFISNGMLEVKTRKSSKAEVNEKGEKKHIIKTFKSLTDKGLEFGKNIISPQNQLGSQPHYFENRFQEFLEKMQIQKTLF